MLFDVQSALAEILNTATPTCETSETRETRGEKGSVSQDSQDSQRVRGKVENGQVLHRPSASTRPDAANDPFRHGRSVTGNPKTWTGGIVSLEAWRSLSEWERHGPNGRHWNGITRRLEQPDGGAA